MYINVWANRSGSDKYSIPVGGGGEIVDIKEIWPAASNH